MIVFASEYIYLVIEMFLVWFLEANAIFTQQIDFGKILIIIYSLASFWFQPLLWTTKVGKPLLNTICNSLFVILKRCKVQNTNIQGF